MSIRLELNVDDCVKRHEPYFKEAQKVVDSEVLRCSDKYVPMRTGNLRRSGQRGTVIGTGKVVYNAPYAKRQYYGLNYHHSEGCAMWFEKAKAVYKYDWLKAANAVMKG